MEAIIEAEPPIIVDIGAAEGYYAAGFARRLPGASISAFEIDPFSRRVLREVVRRNGLHNVTVRGRATHRRIARALVPGSVVLCDVEGYEDVLLDPKRVTALQSTTMIVELHEFAVAGVTARVLDRFCGSHHIDLIDAAPRSGRGRPSLAP